MGIFLVVLSIRNLSKTVIQEGTTYKQRSTGKFSY